MDQLNYQFLEKLLDYKFANLSEIYKFYSKFYINKVKIVPKDINNILKSNLSLAVWFMDDGNGYRKNDAYRLSTYAFGHNGNLLLQKCLFENFEIKTSLIKDSKGYQIYIPITGGVSDRFKKLIYKYIIPKMRYKFRSISPVETDSKEEMV